MCMLQIVNKVTTSAGLLIRMEFCDILYVQFTHLFLVEIKRLPVIYFLLFVTSVFHIFSVKTSTFKTCFQPIDVNDIELKREVANCHRV